MASQPPSSIRNPDPPLTLVLVEPEIPPNTGNVARLCAATGCHLILAGRLGFELSDRYLKRAGLDYWAHVSWEHEPSLERLMARMEGGETGGTEGAAPRCAFMTTKSQTPYTAIPPLRGSWVVFGKETAGLPEAWLRANPQRCYTIPMANPAVRSINLSSAVAVVAFDLLRRIEGF